jgi:pimeloyl-ACP methyl ester carboxylesterase
MFCSPASSRITLPLMAHGDAFQPHPNLEPFLRKLEGFTYFDSFTGGGARAVVLVHGNGDEADSWRHVFQPLSATYRVLAPDLPGFGRSAPRGDGSVKALAQSLEAFLDAVRLERVHLVGSSLGAVVCATLCATHPERVSSLTLGGGASPALGGVQANPNLKPLLEPGTGEAFYNGLRDAGPDAAFQTLQPYYANLERLPVADLEFLRERVWARVWSDSQRDAFFAAMRSLFADQPALTLSDTVPLHLIWGEHDGIMPMQSAHMILHAYPHAKLEVIRGSGHLPHQEKPDLYRRSLETFLESV